MRAPVSTQLRGVIFLIANALRAAENFPGAASCSERLTRALKPITSLIDASSGFKLSSNWNFNY
jgi:hypothetical protein